MTGTKKLAQQQARATKAAEETLTLMMGTRALKMISGRLRTAPASCGGEWEAGQLAVGMRPGTEAADVPLHTSS